MKDKQRRIDVLKTQHEILESKVATAIRHLAGQDRITYLKKQKLKVKDEIVRLQKELDIEQQK